MTVNRGLEPVEAKATPDGSTEHPKSNTATFDIDDRGSSENEEELDHLRDRAWGRSTKIFIWVGMALMWTIFELDNTTVYNCQSLFRSQNHVLRSTWNTDQNYATSEFESISYLGTLTTAGTILSAVLKPPIAKLSDVIGRAESKDSPRTWRVGLAAAAYAITVILYILSYILASSSHAFDQYSASYIIYCIGQTGMQILNQIIVADITNSRTRGLANGLINLPFMIIPWLPALIAIGIALLGALLLYEAKAAAHPVLPFRFLRNSSLVLAWAIGITDSFAFSVTHTYMYAWVVVVHDYGPRNATFLTFTAGCMQVLSGAICGYLMYRTRRYKWLLVAGVLIRLAGYGAMLRLRGASNSGAELFAVQLIQGTGSGIILTVVLVVAQIVVARPPLAQSTALMLQFVYLGNALGSAVAGALYTGLFRARIAHHAPPGLPQEQIDAVYNTIVTGEQEEVRSPEQVNAVNLAYSDVMCYMTLVALVASAIPVVCVWWLRDYRLSERHNLADDVKRGDDAVVEGHEGRAKRWWRTGKWWSQ